MKTFHDREASDSLVHLAMLNDATHNGLELLAQRYARQEERMQKLLDVARAANRLLSPPYKRPSLLCDDREKKDWHSLEDALRIAGIEGERLT